jgi:hypothetical protein
MGDATRGVSCLCRRNSRCMRRRYPFPQKVIIARCRSSIGGEWCFLEALTLGGASGGSRFWFSAGRDHHL